jgi:hypothetical protein
LRILRNEIAIGSQDTGPHVLGVSLYRPASNSKCTANG